jgi:hypothetical protein
MNFSFVLIHLPFNHNADPDQNNASGDISLIFTMPRSFWPLFLWLYVSAGSDDRLFRPVPFLPHALTSAASAFHPTPQIHLFNHDSNTFDFWSGFPLFIDPLSSPLVFLTLIVHL